MGYRKGECRFSGEDTTDPGKETSASTLEDENSDACKMHTNTRSAYIAIIGMAGRFADSTNLEEFWSHLRAGESCIKVINVGEPIQGQKTRLQRWAHGEGC